MKRIWTVAVGVLTLFLCLPVQGAMRDRIVAVVNDDVVTLSELNKAFEPYQGRFAGLMGQERLAAEGDAKRSLLNRRIEQLLIEQQARKSGIVVSPEEVEGMMKDFMARKSLTPGALREALAKEGISEANFKKQMQDDILRMKLARATIQDRGAVSEGEIGDYYLKHREDYEGDVSVRVRQILLSLPREGDPEGKAKVKAELEAIRQRLLKGEPFEGLAAQYSQGPAAEAGGDIGFIQKGMILAEVEEVALHLPVNQISEVIESDVGFHIIQVTDRRGAGLKPLEVVRAEIRNKLEEEKLETRFQQWLAALREKSHIEIKL